MVMSAVLGFLILLLVLMIITRSSQPRVRRSGANDSGSTFFIDGGSDGGGCGDAGGDGGGCGDGGGGGGD